MRIVVCGSRDWNDRETMLEWLRKLPSGSRVAHGAARGADEMAGELAVELGLECKRYPADWTKHGKAAGPIRNREMLHAERPDAVLAFTDSILRSGRLTGTGDCVAAAVEMGIRATIIPSRRALGFAARRPTRSRDPAA